MIVKDKDFVEYISKEEMATIVNKLATEVKSDFTDKTPLFLVMLNGAFVFAADFLRAWGDSVEIEFVKYSSYQGMHSTGVVKPVLQINPDVKGRDLIILEDIVDSGNTMKRFTDELQKYAPKSITLVVLFSKPEMLKESIKIDYLGKALPNRFIVGYGLDYDNFGRNLDAIYVLNEPE